MKKILLYILPIIPVALLFACEEQPELYHEESNRLNFVFENFITDSTTHYTFAYEPDSKLQDTIWIEVSTMGYVTGTDRPLRLKQIEGPAPQAVAGKHYADFNEPSLAALYKIPGGKSKTRLPIVVKRDPSLADTEVTLTFSFEENDFFTSGYASKAIRKITITNQLTQPEYWNSDAEELFAGTYGKVKHRFMINAAAPLGIKIDNNFFYQLVGDWMNIDISLGDYWRAYFTQQLEKENAARTEQNLGPLREEPELGEEEGRLVEF